MQVLALLDELRAMARTGLNYTDDPHDEARYERMLELVSECYGTTLDVPPEEVRDRLVDEMGQVTPKVAADAAIFDDEGRILSLKRPKSGTWCLPGGAVNVGESPREAVIREAQEETGLTVQPETLVGAYNCPPTSRSPYHVIAHTYVCTVTGGELRLSHEGEALEYWSVEDVSKWFDRHEEMAIDAHTHWTSER